MIRRLIKKGQVRSACPFLLRDGFVLTGNHTQDVVTGVHIQHVTGYA